MIWMDVDAALSEVPVNIAPLLDDTDFKTREESVAYNATGMELIWIFHTTAGATTATVVTPTTAGDYDWAHQDGGMYTIEIPASGGASINNDTEGFGYFTGKATGVLPWRGPTIGFRAAGLNNALIDSAYSATRGLAGTAVPDAAADAAGGLPISDAGGLDIDAKLANTNEVTAARMGALTDWIDGGRLDLIIDGILTDTAEIGAAGAGLTEAGGTGDHLTALTVDLNADQSGVTIGTVTTNTDMRGTDSALLASSAPTNFGDMAIEVTTGIVSADAIEINSVAAAAAQLAKSAQTIVSGTVDTVTNTHTPTTTEFQADDITEATADHFIGRIVIFTSGVLQNQATDITDYAAVGGIGQLTVTALTEAPSNDDTFIIV
jgi:hypothetical protein